MVVKIIITRKAPKEIDEELRPLLIQLRNKATVQPGYISGETLRNIDNPDESIVISTWQSLEQWKSWLNNNERIEIQNMIDIILDEKTKYSVYQYS